MRLFSALFTLIFISTFSHASELEFAISDESIETSYQSFYAGNFGIDVSWLHTDVDDTKGDIAGFGLYAHGKTGKVRTHLGGKAFWMHEKEGNENKDMHGIALGGAVDVYIIPTLFIKGKVLYAPNILTGGDFENYLELGARLSYKLLPNAAVFVGYRYIDIENDDKNLTDDDNDYFKGGFIGFNFNI